MNPFLQTQIEWIKALNGHHITWLNDFFIFCNHLDSLAFYSLVAVAVWMGVHRLRGIELLALALINGFVGQVLKDFYDMPRPFQMDPSAGLVVVSGNGLPSGAAGMAMLWGGFLIYHLRSHLSAWIIGIVYILFFSFVRVYLGVHFVSDILMGWFVGATELFLYIRYNDLIRKKLLKYTPQKRFLTLLFVAALAVALFFKMRTFNYLIIASAYLLGIYLDDRFNPKMANPKSCKEGLVRALVSLGQLSLILWFIFGLQGIKPVQVLMLMVGSTWMAFVAPRINTWISSFKVWRSR
ncbi:MAG: phosphatase PAP2 family protein [Simkaniaceae bacterium]|nr:phosphatase PAP2 family protein [Simkaniaceae bacterium]MCF7852773.1 phosphatase PAP2 family protein [Simkaniaceae bacterium]